MLARKKNWRYTMKIKVWVVSMIDCYGGDMSDCWCTFRNYNGVKVFTSYKEAEEFGTEHKQGFAADYEIEEFEVEVNI
jgi:hypothetical protein